MRARLSSASALFGVLTLSTLSAPASSGPSHAATWVLNPGGTGDFPTIQAAIAAAADGDEILLEDGTYTRDGDDVLDFLGKAITVRSASGNAAACVIDGETDDLVGAVFQSGEGPLSVLADLTFTRTAYTSSVLSIDDASPTIRNVTVQSSRGAAISTSGGSPLLEGLTLCEGSSPTVWATGGTPVFSGCLLEANTLANSTGGLIVLSADATFEDCTIRDFEILDHSLHAAVAVLRASVTLRRCHIRGNATQAILINGDNTGSTVLLEECVVENNRNGVWVHGRTHGPLVDLTIRDCLIADNEGHGLETRDHVNTVIEDSTVRGNRSGVAAVAALANPTLSITMRNTVVQDNPYGGVYCRYPILSLEGCRIQGNGNAYVYQGGLYLFGVLSGEIRDCLVTGNARTGMTLRGGAYIVEGCTIASNATAPSGGGLQVEDGAGVTLRRSIVWGNCAADRSEMLIESGSSIELDCVAADLSRITGEGTVTVVGDVLQQDPMLCWPAACSAVPTSQGTYSFAFHSPAHQAECGHMGALPPGCQITGVESLTWGQIKARHR